MRVRLDSVPSRLPGSDPYGFEYPVRRQTGSTSIAAEARAMKRKKPRGEPVSVDLATPPKASKAPNRKSIKGVNISPNTRVSLYAQARFLPREFKEDTGLLLPFVKYFQDPF